MTVDAALGLRERKRLATRRAIQVAVLELVADRGLDGVTIEDISRVVDISPRTFFNYFATKEEAVIGDGPSLPSGPALDDFVEGRLGSDILSGLGELLAQTAALSSDDVELVQARKKILRDSPQLFARRMATMRSFEDHIAEIVKLRLVVDDPRLTADEARLTDRSRLIALVAFAAMRHAWTCWADESSINDLADRMRSSFADLRTVLGDSDRSGDSTSARIG